MRRVIVRYKVKADRVPEHVGLIRGVFDELRQTSPDGLRYGAFRLADGVSFVHVASIETETGENPLSASGAFVEFQRELGDRCDEQPVAVDMEEIGSYRLLGGG